MKKVEVKVRFANESNYYNKITIDPQKIETPTILNKEVFFTIDGIRVATKSEDWEQIKKLIN